MRITGGKFRSRPLEAPRGSATRPTSDRVREALFAILGSRWSVDGARVLDLYAGTGALAFEALSRGAGSAVLVESARAPLLAIQANARALDVLSSIQVVAMTVERAVATVHRAAPFEVVFADPPYAAIGDGKAVLALHSLLLCPSGLLTAGGCLVVEHAKDDPAPNLAGVAFVDSRRYGDTTLSFYAPASQSGVADGGDDAPCQR
jgi:16S rRNA (guanine966-N2)-methyltransferase